MRTFFTPSMAVRCGVPRLYDNILLDEITPRNQEQIEYKQKLWDLLKHKAGWCLLVLGTIGNGKTMLACSAVNLYNDVYPDKGLYITQEDFLRKIKSTYSDDSKTSEGAVLDRYLSAGLVVIDEVTPRGWTEYSRNVMSNFLSTMHANKKMVVLIGNVLKEDIDGMFEPHILSRFKEGQCQYMVEEDMRGGVA